jgi:hypothetical protein
MHQEQDPAADQYPHGRGYGNDYMRGGEVLGGYGYSAREAYSLPRGELEAEGPPGEEGEPSDGASNARR